MILVDQNGKEWELKEKAPDPEPWWHWSDLIGLLLALIALHLIFI